MFHFVLLGVSAGLKVDNDSRELPCLQRGALCRGSRYAHTCLPCCELKRKVLIKLQLPGIHYRFAASVANDRIATRQGGVRIKQPESAAQRLEALAPGLPKMRRSGPQRSFMEPKLPAQLCWLRSMRTEQVCKPRQPLGLADQPLLGASAEHRCRKTHALSDIR